MSETIDLTVQILREIRDDVRGVKEEARKTNERLERVEARLERVEEEARTTNVQLEHLTGRVNAIEVVVKDMAGQFTLLTRFVKNTQKRMNREMADMQRRLTAVEERVGLTPE